MNSTLRVASRYGPIFDTSVGEGFSLDTFVHDVRSKGYYFNGAVYVPHDTIAFITLIAPGVVDTLETQLNMAMGQTRQ